MGSGRWSTDVYDAAARFRAATGASAFAYSDGGATRVHPALDPFGVTVRESRDSAEHPRSLAVAVLFDVTGSMGGVPRALQAKLPQLLGLLLRKGYAADPQVMFGAIGDATCDRAPLQVGQFESDNRMDDDLGRILLEGGGGGQKTESYELALYFMARHTAIDCYAKRGRRGYLFVIGDEMAYPQVKPAEVRDMIGGGLQASLPLPALIDEVTAKWDTYYVLPAGASYAGDRQVLGFWRDLLGQNVIQLNDLDAVCETIALTVGLGEDAVNLDGGLAAEAGHLASAGVPGALDRLTVDRDALLVTPYHQAANRARETARGRDRHGSCGMGIGETARYALAWPGDAPRVADCAAPRMLARSLGRLRDRLYDELGPFGGPAVDLVCDAYRAFADRVPLVDGGYLRRLLNAGPAVFEGAQGVLLDEWRGFHPYTTWSTTTFANAETLLAEAGETAVRLGVVRSYLTRHGPGPFVTEDPTLEIPEPHNGTGTWQGAFRTGHPDAVALRYAAEVAGGVDGVALTHLDVAARHQLRLCRAYQADGWLTSRIEPGPEHDLSWQERLTDRLLRSRPVYSDPVGGGRAGGDPVGGGRVGDWVGDWPGVFEDVLGAPVVLRSYGPTAAAKLGQQSVTALPGRGRSMSRLMASAMAW